jgi:hypothetical protein
MAGYTIEKGVPILPQKRPGAGRKSKYPFRDMEVGDSFMALGVAPITVRRAAYWSGRRLNKKFMTRTVEGGVRVWRVE